ncbi:MAG TPA: DUF1028 domain-containing protein [Patescibacteria group bacterium]|nr:DUF1028 domain-containing protein [Patescibacteria group bacterium]
MQTIATFSIVAFDPRRQEWGVAVQSKFMAAAAVVSWARAGAGAVATQAYANMAYGPDGLDLLARGISAPDVITALISADDESEVRQVGLIDRHGEAAAYTGSACDEWAGHIIGQGYACQGNILIPGTIEAMAAKFEEARRGNGELADWLVASLAAGQDAGGDSRGRQAAGVLVVRENGGYGDRTDRYLDLRVDDDPYPIRKLSELVKLHHLFFGDVNPDDLVPLSEVAEELQRIMQRSGDYTGAIHGRFDTITREALIDLVGKENMEDRWDGEGEMIDQIVVDYLRKQYPEES